MRYGYRKLAKIVRHKFLRNPMNGDVYMFMNKQRTTVRMFQFENHAFYVHEKHYIEGYKFMNIETEEYGTRRTSPENTEPAPAGRIECNQQA